MTSIGKLPAGRVPDPHSPTLPVQLCCLGGSTEGGRDSQPARLERPGNRISLEGKCKML
jgi:hypothetical protein